MIKIKNRPMLILAALSLLVLVLTHTTLATQTAQFLGQDEIVNSINSYLDESEKSSSEQMIKLAELDALFAMLQSSEVGISFIIDAQVKVGHLLSAFNDALVKATEAAALAVVSIEVIKMVVDLSEAMTPWLFSLALVGVAMYGLNRALAAKESACGIIDRFAKLSVALFLVFHLFLPYSLYGAASFSQHMMAEAKYQNHSALTNLHQDVDASHKKQSLKDRAEGTIHAYEKVTLSLPQKVEVMTVYHTRHMAMTLFEFMILPIVLFAISIGAVYWVARR